MDTSDNSLSLPPAKTLNQEQHCILRRGKVETINDIQDTKEVYVPHLHLIYQSYPSRNKVGPEEQPDYWKLKQAATTALPDTVSVPRTGP